MLVMKVVLLLVALGCLVGCAPEPVRAQKEPTVDERLQLIDKQKDVPQGEKEDIKRLVQSYKDKDEFENTASH